MIYDTLKSIKLKHVFILYFYISCFFSNIFAQDSSQTSFDTPKDIRSHFYTAVSASDFTNDQLKTYKTRSMIILNYMDVILRKILDNNEKLLSQYGVKKEDIETRFRIIAYSSGALVNANKVITIELSKYNILRHFTFNADTIMIATFAHELAHILLNHIQQEDDLMKKFIEEFIEQHKDEITIENIDSKTLRQLYEELNPVHRKQFSQFMKNNEDRLNLRKQQEIEADNLGLTIFLNTGFHIEHYTNHILHIGLPEDRLKFHGDPLWLKFYILKDYLVQKYRGLPYPSSDIEKIRSIFTRYSDQVDKKIENYKYTYGYIRAVENILFNLPTLYHPTALWRFWNNLQQEKNISQNLPNNKNIVTTEYIKIDLSEFEEIDNIKPLLDKKYSFNDTLNLKDTNNPILYILNALFNDNSNISYQFFSSNLPVESLGVIQDDNTIVLKANDVFRAAALSLAKDINNLGATTCTKLFSQYHEIERDIVELVNQHYVLSTVIVATIYGVLDHFLHSL